MAGPHQQASCLSTCLYTAPKSSYSHRKCKLESNVERNFGQGSDFTKNQLFQEPVVSAEAAKLDNGCSSVTTFLTVVSVDVHMHYAWVCY